MKFLNDFKNLFAIVGVVSIIFFTCASESTSTNVNLPQLTGGTYQVAMADYRMVILNTETGVLKTYVLDDENNWEWTEGTINSTSIQSFGSGNLTATH